MDSNKIATEDLLVGLPYRAKSTISQVGAFVLNYAEYIGGIAFLAARTIKTLFTERPQWNLILAQVYHIGVKSLSLTNLIAIFTGMVVALQFIVGLKRFGLELYVGQIVGLAICRELGPVLTALMVASRVGAGIAAELGSMTVTEQVLAIKAIGANPISKLVIPRVLVVTIITPLLTVIADVVGIIGSMIVTVTETGVSAAFYQDQIIKTVQMDDFISGVGKTFFFGFLIGTISCYQGLKTSHGTQGVGYSTTLSVVLCAVAIFVADYFLTKIFLLF